MSNHVVNRLADLPRPSSEFPRRFAPAEIDFSSWENLKPLFDRLLDRKLDSVEAIEEWLLDQSELGSIVSEERSRLSIAMTCDTEDKEKEAAYLHFVEHIIPHMKPVHHQLDRKLIDSPYSAELPPQRYEVMLRSTRNSIELFREENIPLQTELTKLSQEYQKICGAMMVTFQGKEMTLQQVGKFAESDDRELRRDAFDVATKRRLEDADKLEELFDKMLVLRTQVAQNAGFDDFRAYQFRDYERFDYTPEDCLDFHDAVENVVLPIIRQSLEERRESLKLDSVRPYDISCDRYGRPPLEPFETTGQLVEGCRKIFGYVDEELGGWFQQMIDLGLLDLDSRKGKAPGGYQSTLSEVRLPFIFMNAVGTNRNMFTLLHEGGHAFHSFASRNEPLLGYRHAPMEFCEVASMSMEHLGGPHLDVFYNAGDAARAWRNSLLGDIGLLSWVAIIDAFQHWIYTNPEHNREERTATWLEITDRFSSGVDWSGYDDVRRSLWHAQLHIFEVPFYYIEYAIALLGALQVWRNSLTDLPATVEAYKAALKLGGSRPLPELFNTAGIEFDFTKKMIKPLMDDVQREIDRTAELETH